jgi:hypothetical protein
MTPLEAHIKLARSSDAELCVTCGQPLAWEHDHRPGGMGLDDGPWLPGRAPRKKPDAKPADEVREIRLLAWATRRKRYGSHGHR